MYTGWLKRQQKMDGHDLAEIRRSGKLKVLLAYDPINYFIYRGAPMGYSYELAERFAQEIGVQLEVVLVRDMNLQVPLLRNRDADIIATPMAATSQQSRMVDFSPPIDASPQVLVQHVATAPAALVRSPEELAGKTVYVHEKSAFYNTLKDLAENRGIKVRIISVNGALTTSELVRMVDRGKIGYTVADSNLAVTLRPICPNIDIRTRLSVTQQLSWAVRKDSPKLRHALAEWIGKERKTGTLQAIRNKYASQENGLRKKTVSTFYGSRTGALSPYDRLIRQEARRIGWDWRLLASLIYEESQFDPDIVSWAGAVGLMQVMPATGTIIGISDLTTPESNIRAGVAYLATLEKEWGDIRERETRLKFILASYNVGPGHVRDAQKLAVKYGAQPNLWENNVEKFLLLKSEAKFYNDAVASLGYCNGAVPVSYTRNILRRYRQYRQLMPN